MLQAVDEVVTSLRPLFERYPKYLSVLPAVIEPERVVQFRVPWQDDKVGDVSEIGEEVVLTELRAVLTKDPRAKA